MTSGRRPRSRRPKTEAKAQATERGGSTSLPQGSALLDKIRPHMRRNRRGPGGSGSTTFLSRALKCSEVDLKAAFVALGLVVPANSNEKPVFVEFGDELWWLNADSRGGLWINGREKKPGETALNAEKELETDYRDGIRCRAIGGTGARGGLGSNAHVRTVVRGCLRVGAGFPGGTFAGLRQRFVWRPGLDNAGWQRSRSRSAPDEGNKNRFGRGQD